MRGSRVLRLWRFVYQNTMAWLFTAIYIPILLSVILLSLGRLADTLGYRMVRGWGQTMLWIYGVKLVILNEAPLEVRANRLFTFNHASTLDMFIGTALLPPGGVPVTKKEFLYVPFLGQAIFLMRYVTIDRKNRERATESLKRAGQRLRAEKLTALIAPEGTRSLDGSLGPFKLGPFHLALNAKSTILPAVYHHTTDIWPRTQLHSNTGTVVVEFLPEMKTDDFTPENLRERADGLREAYLEALARGPSQQSSAKVEGASR